MNRIEIFKENSEEIISDLKAITSNIWKKYDYFQEKIEEVLNNRYGLSNN